MSLYVYCFDIGANVSARPTFSLFVPSLVCTAVVVDLVSVLYWC